MHRTRTGWLLWLALAGVARADDVVVGNGTPASCTTAAYNAAMAQLVFGVQSPGGTLSFNCGPNLHTIQIDQQHGLAGDIQIDGGGKIRLQGPLPPQESRFFEIVLFNPEDQTAVRIRNIAFLFASRSADFGGAILQRNGTFLSLDRVDANLCFSGLSGGVIASEPGTTLEVRNSRFDTNLASSGGAIASSGQVLIEDSVFVGNDAARHQINDQQGGAIQSWGGNLIVRRSHFEDNNARYGGAIYKRDQGLEVSDSTFLENENDPGSGINQGGAIMSIGSHTLIERSHFEGNDGSIFATSFGAALYLSNSVGCAVRNSSFVGNSSEFGSTMQLDRNCSFDQISVAGSPFSAAIRMNGGVQALFTHSSLLAHTAALITTDNSGTAFPRFSQSVVAGTVSGFVAPTSGGGNVLASNMTLGGPGDENLADPAALGLGGAVISAVGTTYYPPLPGSPLIDRIATCAFVADAIGTPRPVDGDGNGSALCDVGAIELQPAGASVFVDGFE